MRYYERQTGLNIWGYSPNTADVTRWGNVPYLVQKRSTPLVTGTVTGSNLSGGATFTPRGTTMLNFNQNTTAANSGNAYLTAFEANAEF
jgi:hypothetical protein